ncbi:hypothetical protein [Nocardioides luteus]|uniref:EfeO-type cupredoxin-like domain-containing protein n=1 Tax=Nocardioides luteus TaxID=1844 RepID=A0A1J4N985_9ACTN|nr:hypothetical protein [Nocardioides luteus]OIJ28046.1 hypothetical protein UG56_004935 [Nocardioides luteus]
MPSFHRPFGRISATAAVTFTLALVLAACGSTGEDAAPTAEPSDATTSVTPSAATSSGALAGTAPESTDRGPLLTVTINGEEVSPNVEEFELGTGEKLLVEVDSDRAGELHVHSAPEQFIEFAAGTTNTEIVVNTPGTVEVEDHETSAVVAIIEVR